MIMVKENCYVCHVFVRHNHVFLLKLAEELAAKEEEDANKKPKGKEETKEKGKKEKVNDEVRIEERS